MSWPMVSPLRQRMTDDIRACKLGRHSERNHIESCKRFAAFLKRSPETATPDDVRAFQLSLIEAEGLSIGEGARIAGGVSAGGRAGGRCDAGAQSANSTASAMPVLRWSHVRHRDLRPRLHAKTSANTKTAADQDRYVMSTALPATCSAAIWPSAGVGYMHASARNSCSRGTHVGGHAIKNAQTQQSP